MISDGIVTLDDGCPSLVHLSDRHVMAAATGLSLMSEATSPPANADRNPGQKQQLLRKVSIDDLINDNLDRAFDSCFGEFQSVSPGTPAKHRRHPGHAEYTQERETAAVLSQDLDSLWNDLIGDLDQDRRNCIDDQVVLLVSEERFIDAIKIRQEDELDGWRCSNRLLWKDLVEFVPEYHRPVFLKQFPDPPAKIAESDLLAAARLQAVAHDLLRQMIGLLPHDVETRQIHWTEMIKHVLFELARSYGVFESIIDFCSRSCKKQCPYWSQASTLHRVQMYSQGLREMIRVLYRLQASLPNIAALKPSSPVFLLLSTALKSASELIRWIQSKREGSDSIVKAIRRNLVIDEGAISPNEGAISANDIGPICQICYLICDANDGHKGSHIATSWIIHDNVTMHSSCANLFSRSTNREPSCLKMTSFAEQLGQ